MIFNTCVLGVIHQWCGLSCTILTTRQKIKTETIKPVTAKKTFFFYLFFNLLLLLYVKNIKILNRLIFWFYCFTDSDGLPKSYSSPIVLYIVFSDNTLGWVKIVQIVHTAHSMIRICRIWRYIIWKFFFTNDVGFNFVDFRIVVRCLYQPLFSRATVLIITGGKYDYRTAIVVVSNLWK